ncbi:MAG: endonuclease III domain-containing protein [Thermoanaerobaculia bacterium]
MKTGLVWLRSSTSRTQHVRRVCATLSRAYPRTRFGNPRDPLDDLIFIVLSNRSTPTVSARVYKELKSTFEAWGVVADASVRQISAVLRPVGLANIRAKQIRRLLREIRRRFGRCTLSPLTRYADAEALHLLTLLPGVSGKVARCVMMYTMSRSVLPVDVHMHRIAVRLGWTSRKRADQSHEELEALVPRELRYRLHVNAIQHGRAVCRPTNPVCSNCVLAAHCVTSGRSLK